MSDPNITVRLNVDFFKERQNLPKCDLTVFTGRIDAYYSSQGLPKLEYRSLRFLEEYHEPETDPEKTEHPGFYQPCLQLNYPGPEVDYTRIVEYKHKPNQPEEAKRSKGTVIFKEFSCAHGEPYYPVPNPANCELFEKYQKLAAEEPGVCFVGRLASYKYFNMDQAFLNALETFDEVKKGTALRRTELGEALPPDLASKLLRRSSRLVNVYGPTETCIWSTFNIVRDATDTSIGRPLDNQWVFVLDQHGNLVPPHMPGELWIGGLGVATGYLNDRVRTSERFVNNPFSRSLAMMLPGTTPQSMMYRTGDMVRWNLSKKLEYLGRCDRQTKVNGFRVELEAVEAVILNFPGVQEAIVQVREIGNASQMVAYCRPEDIDTRQLETYVRSKLPAHMCPSSYVSMRTFPKTPNNKVDKDRLPSPELNMKKDVSPSQSQNADAANRLWSAVLGYDTSAAKGVNFAELGGGLFAVESTAVKDKEHRR